MLVSLSGFFEERIMKIKLSDHFTLARLVRFVLPSVIMMMFISIYGVVDGFFVSNFAGKTDFAAINLIWPFPMLLGAFGFMIGTGGSALVSMKLGQGEEKKANEIFSMLIKVTIIAGILLSVFGIVFIEDIAVLLGAEGDLIDPAVTYGRILLVSLTPFLLQNVFQSFLVTAEKPTLGLITTVLAGVTNMVLDLFLVGIFPFGIVGAAVASALSQLVGAVIPLIYFLHKKNKSLLRIIPSRMDFSALLRTCTNGSSELMTNVSFSLVNMLYNIRLLHFAGENGLAAYGVLMYVNFIFVSVFIGYAIGTAPIIGFNYGAQNKKEMRNVYRKSIVFNILAGMLMFLSAFLLATPLSKLFVGYDQALFELTRRGFILYSLSFTVTGLNIYASSFFTALGNGLISATISFMRTLLFQVLAILLLPHILGLDGIWLAVLAAELLSLFVSGIFLLSNKKKYGY